MNWGSTQLGSSMIELIATMTLAGFAMASVAPALISLEDTAFDAKIDGAIGAVHSANYQAHASWLVAEALHRSTATVRMENEDISMDRGWIDIHSVAIAAGINCSTYGCIYNTNTAIFLAASEAKANTPCFIYSVEPDGYRVSPRLTWNLESSNCE